MGGLEKLENPSSILNRMSLAAPYSKPTKTEQEEEQAAPEIDPRAFRLSISPVYSFVGIYRRVPPPCSPCFSFQLLADQIRSLAQAFHRLEAHQRRLAKVPQRNDPRSPRRGWLAVPLLEASAGARPYVRQVQLDRQQVQGRPHLLWGASTSSLQTGGDALTLHLWSASPARQFNIPVATYATTFILSAQFYYILRFFLSKNIRIARERAWAQVRVFLPSFQRTWIV